MDNRVIDRYTLELEALSEHEHSPLPVRCIATNTDDKSTAEAWMSLEMTRTLLNFAYGNQQTFTDHFMQQLQDHHYADLTSPQPEPHPGAQHARCVFNAIDLLPYGFVHDDLRPWRPE
jgi:hypothetical protein